MSTVKYFVVQPFREQLGELYPCEPIEVRSTASAVATAKKAAAEHGGAIAFSREGNPATGEFQDAQIIGRFGETPSDEFLYELG